MQPTLDFNAPPSMPFDGLTFIGGWDSERLTGQWKAVYDVMQSGKWYTLGEIRERIGGGSEAGISARLRDFRKIKFGGHKVYRRRRGEASKGLHEYRLELKADMEIAA